MIRPVIESERLVLRPLAASDVGLLELYTSDLQVAGKTRSIPHPLPPGASAAFVERVTSGAEPGQCWAIDHRGSEGGALIATIGLTDKGEVGYWLGAPFWDTGFATEAGSALVDEVRRSGAYDRLRAEVFQDNPASARVLTKAGFAYASDGQVFCVARGSEVPVWQYALEFGDAR